MLEEITAIISDLAYLRLRADIELVQEFPALLCKPYPLGRCMEIRDKVFQLLVHELKSGPKTKGLQAIRAYIEKGHSLNPVWGGLRRLYFQNAMHLGEYYIDVANDTVDPNKPRVEILRMEESGFVPISDFEQFVEIAKKYWKVEVYRNSVCSSLAPFVPFLILNKENKSCLYTNNYLVELAQQSGFEKTLKILAALPEICLAHSSKWRELIDGNFDDPLLNNNYSAEEFCKIYRDQDLHNSLEFRNRIVGSFLRLVGRGEARC